MTGVPSVAGGPGDTRTVLRLAVPIVGSNLLQRGVGIVDALLVGRLGATELAAVGLAQLFVFFFMSLVMGVGVGSTVAVAFHTGARETVRREQTVRTSLSVGAVLAVGIGVTGLVLTRPLASLLGAPERVADLAVSYLTLVWIFFLFKTLLTLGSSIFQGAGDTKTPLVVVGGVNMIHVALALPLIFGWGALPSLGVVGAAVASVISEGVGAVALLALAARRGLLVPHGGWVHREEGGRILRISLPVVGERILTSTMQMVYARIVLSFGVAAYAAHQVGLNIEALSYLPGLGFGQAATTLVGQRLGARDREGARRSGYRASAIGVVTMSLMGVTFFFFPRAWTLLFTSDPTVLAYGGTLLPIMGLLQPILALAMGISGALRGAGETRLVMYTAIVGGWCVRIPVAYVGGVLLGGGLVVVWITMILDWLTRGLWALHRFRSSAWEKRNL